MVKKVGIVMEMVELKLLWVDEESFFFAILQVFQFQQFPYLESTTAHMTPFLLLLLVVLLLLLLLLISWCGVW